MKFLLAFFMISGAFAQQKLIRGEYYSRRGEYEPPQIVFTSEELNKVLFSETQLYKEELKKVKYFLMNGELQLAKVYLQKLSFGQARLRPITNRYLGMIAFIEQDYRKSIEFLTTGELKNQPYFARICGLIVLNKIVLNEVKGLEDDWDRCRKEAASDINVTNFVWLDTLVKLKLDPRPGITAAPFVKLNLQALETVDLKILLKLGIYLNQEKLLVEKLPTLLPEHLTDPEVRELSGHIWFRSGKFANAYKFVEDIKSPNAENMKGNLYLLREKYEIAYAQFKLALREKQNSQNALERLVPTAWLLGDWKSGADYARQIVTRPGAEANKLTIMAAFEMQAGNYDRARSHLLEIRQKSRRGSALEVNQIASFSALMENKPEELAAAASQSCALQDIVNCWVLFQMYHWDNFPLIIRRGDEIPRRDEWPMLIEEKLKTRLTEPAYVFQQDIEELDDQNIKLVK